MYGAGQLNLQQPIWFRGRILKVSNPGQLTLITFLPGVGMVQNVINGMQCEVVGWKESP